VSACAVLAIRLAVSDDATNMCLNLLIMFFSQGFLCLPKYYGQLRFVILMFQIFAKVQGPSNFRGLSNFYIAYELAHRTSHVCWRSVLQFLENTSGIEGKHAHPVYIVQRVAGNAMHVTAPTVR
jgi:hypothetical protein